MEIEEKLRILKSLGTKSLMEKLHQYEDELQKEMTAEADFKAQNHNFLGSGDCQEVKKILEIPEGLRIACAFRLGYAVPSPQKYLRVRREVEDFTYRNRFGSKFTS